MGMVFQSISAYNASPPFQTLISEGVITSQVFGLKIATSSSELFLGGTNSSLYTGNFTWVPLTVEVCSNPKALIVASADKPSVDRATGKRLSIALLWTESLQ